jgi:hypothetical protein
VKGKDAAKRIQLPLKVAYAITIHKSQGMSLNILEVDCSGIFAAGQLGVAVGRATSTSGLRLLHFNPRKHVLPADKHVKDFYDDLGEGLDVNLTCCSKQATLDDIPDVAIVRNPEEDDTEDVSEEELVLMLAQLADEHNEGDVSEGSVDSDSDKSINCTQDESDLYSDPAPMAKIDVTTPKSPLPFPVNARTLLNDLIKEDAETKVQHSMNDCITYLLTIPECQKLAEVTLSSLQDLWKISGIKAGVTHVPLRDFYTAFQKYRLKDYRKQCHIYLGQRSDEMFLVLSEFLLSIRAKLIEFHRHQQAESTPSTSNKVVDMSDAGKGKVRHLAGRSIAMAKKRVLQQLNTALSSNRGKGSTIDFGQQQILHLNHMRTTYEDLRKGPYASTLDEIERRQNWGGGLTHVTDVVFIFYMNLEHLRQNLHTMKNVAKYKGKILSWTTAMLLDDASLNEGFQKVFEDLEEKNDTIVAKLFIILVENYLVCANNEFRLFVADSLGKRKKHAHRKFIKGKRQS